MSKVIDRITSTAERLAELRAQIAKKEEENKKELEVLKVERDATQNALLADLNKNKLSSIKTRDGITFSRGVKKGIEIVSEVFALKWAIEHRAVSVNKILVAQALKDVEEMPQGFKFVETEFVRVTNPNKKEDGEKI